MVERQTKINNKTTLLVALQQKKLIENYIRLFSSVLESPFSAVVLSSARGVTPSPLDQCSMLSPPPQYDQSPGQGCSNSLHQSQQQEIEYKQSQEPESQSSESVVPETALLAPET